MKKLLLSTAVVAIMALSGTAQAAVGEGTADAYVVTPIEIDQEGPLDFGSFTGDAGTVDTSTAPYYDGPTPVPGTGIPTPGIFYVSGEADESYTFEVDNDVTLTHTIDDTYSMDATLSSIQEGPVLAINDNTALVVNGVLTVLGTEIAGSYKGTYGVTAIYQ